MVDKAVSAPTTEDRFLSGRLVLSQPRRGHRAGIEAVLIAAAAPLAPGETLVDIGAGVGAAGLCAMARIADSGAILVEADPALAELASDNAARNGLAARTRVVTCDVTSRGAAARAGLTGGADHALANPPFYDPAASRLSPHKKSAHGATKEALDAWMRFAAAALRPGGTLTLVHRADALQLVLEACSPRFGGLKLCPVHPRPGLPASRLLVQGTKGSRAPLTLLAGLTLHDNQGNAFLPEIEAVLRGGAGLSLAGGHPLPHLNGPGDPKA